MASSIFGGVFLWKAYQTLSSCQNFPTGQSCQNFPTGQPAKLSIWLASKTFQLVGQQNLASINNTTPNILTKWPPVAITVPSGTQRHHWGIGIPGYTFGSSIQARLIQPPSWGSAFPVTTGSL